MATKVIINNVEEKFTTESIDNIFKNEDEVARKKEFNKLWVDIINYSERNDIH